LLFVQGAEHNAEAGGLPPPNKDFAIDHQPLGLLKVAC
jgi:hypothetical protein